MRASIKRRAFLQQAALATGAVMIGGAVRAAAGSPPAATEKGSVAGEPAIHRLTDPAHPTELEQKHVPVITVEGMPRSGEPLSVTVKIGAVTHPMLAEHHIEWVELLVDGAAAGRAEFRPGLNLPQLTLALTLDRPATLTARAFCNLHGLWESQVELGRG